ncbi:MAG: response regulator [bacterium]
MSEKILIVEDEEDLRKALEIRLKQHNFRVIMSKDGEDGLKKAKEEFPDLIILDVVLPKMSGFEACHRLKADPKYKHIPVIMLSIKSSEDAVKKGYENGTDEYITKPFDWPFLFEKIKSLLSKK